MPFEGPLKPGDAIGVMLVNGDLQMGGTGTVTHIDDDRVYAFGHPLYNLGPTEFPMTRAYVYTVLPSLLSSFKLSTTGEVIGTFLQDRATTIAGRSGPGPRMIPVTVNLTQARASERTFNFEVVNDQLFTPLMTYAALLNTLELVRAPVRRGHVQRPRAGEREGPRGDRVRRSLLRPTSRRWTRRRTSSRRSPIFWATITRRWRSAASS